MIPILELRHVSHLFGGLRALNDISFSLSPAEVVGLIGPNGAGKTTLVNVITGFHRLRRGEILFNGRRVNGLPSYKIARLGIARTFQIVQPFPRMTVLDNVAAAALFAGGAETLAEARAQALEHLTFVGVDNVSSLATLLPLADRKRLELAKSLAMNPRLLLLDEVNAGLSAAEITHALSLIRRLAERGITVLLIEHLMRVVMAVCSRVVVLHHGEMIANGFPAEVVRDSRVVAAYLGKRWVAREAEKIVR